jgi:NADP-dependent 3-hydroxy acid dehydrogenase YdfG
MARREALLQELLQERRPRGERAFARGGDATRREDVASFLTEAVRRVGRIDVLVISVGLNIRARTLQEISAEDWDRVLATNRTSAFHCTQCILPQLHRQGGGLILCISSVSALLGDASGPAYQAAKHGLSGLVDALRQEETDRRIRTSIIFPGVVNTPLLLHRPVVPSPEQRAIALQPEEVAQACLFIARMPPAVTIPELVLRPTLP